MTRETKVGIVVVGSFLTLVGVVVSQKLRPAPDSPAPDSKGTPVAQVTPKKEKSPASEQKPKVLPASLLEPSENKSPAPTPAPTPAVKNPDPLANLPGLNGDLKQPAATAQTLADQLNQQSKEIQEKIKQQNQQAMQALEQKGKDVFGQGLPPLVPPPINPPAAPAPTQGTNPFALPPIAMNNNPPAPAPIKPLDQPPPLPGLEQPKVPQGPGALPPPIAPAKTNEPLPPLAGLPGLPGVDTKQPGNTPPLAPPPVAPLEKKDPPPLAPLPGIGNPVENKGGLTPLPPLALPGEEKKNPLPPPLTPPLPETKGLATPPLPGIDPPPVAPLPGLNPPQPEPKNVLPPIQNPAPLSPPIPITTRNDLPPINTQPTPGVQPIPASNVPIQRTGTNPGTPVTINMDPSRIPVIGNQPDRTLNPPNYAGSAGQVTRQETKIETIRPGSESWEALSRAYYGSDRYARALQSYNRDQIPLMSGLGNQFAGSTQALSTGQRVIIPTSQDLETGYRNLLGSVATQPQPQTPRPGGLLGQPTPLTPIGTGGNAPTADRVSMYRVPANGKMIQEIAREQLGDRALWTEIYRLNPNYPPQLPIPGDVTIRIPAR